MVEVCNRFFRHENVGIPPMGTGIYCPGSLAEVLPSDTSSDNSTTFCKVSPGDEIRDGGRVPMLPGFSAEMLVMKYDGLLASMAVVSGSVIMVL
jgi:hypothetical protein